MAPKKPTLKIENCVATAATVKVFFSEPLDISQMDTDTGTDPDLIGNYIVSNPSSSPPTVIITRAIYDSVRNVSVLQLNSSLARGTWLSVSAPGVSAASGALISAEAFYVRVDGDDDVSEDTRRVTQAAEDAVAYPIMTEQVGLPPSSSFPSGNGGGGAGGYTGGGRLQIGQTATHAIADVLGWKLNDNDPKGFVGALTQSFTLTEVEGHVESTWTPRTYAVLTDLSGGITGAQASMYTRAQDALQSSLPLLNGLYTLNPDTDAEMVTALKDIVSSQFTELVNELGNPGGPRISRVNQYFNLLLGDPLFLQLGSNSSSFTVTSEPDSIKGTLGRLRKELEVQSTSRYVNTVEDEQDVTSYRILSDYLTSLAQSWVNNIMFFGLDTKKAFLGTQLVLLSRQLSVISESVEEVRFTLDSVFIGPSERQTLQLEFASGDSAMFIEDLLSWTQSFAQDEGPQLIQNAGKLGVGDGFLPVVRRLHALVGEARHPVNKRKLPDGYRTIRVEHSLKDLEDQLKELARLAEGVKLKKPPTVFDPELLQKIRDEITDRVQAKSLKP
jgi:hypothetical protein